MLDTDIRVWSAEGGRELLCLRHPLPLKAVTFSPDGLRLASGADDVVLNTDRLAELAEDAKGLDPARARAAVEWVLDTRRRLRVNVSEELALEALWLRLAATLSG